MLTVSKRLSIIRRTHDYASVMELVDMTDSKSVAFASVAVRVRPLVPFNKP